MTSRALPSLPLFPDAEADGSSGESAKPRRKERKIASPARPATKSASEERKQPKLAGLALRGRPPKRDKLSASERASESRSRRMTEGARRVEIILPAQAAEALDRLVADDGSTRTDVVSGLILRADARRRRAGGR